MWAADGELVGLHARATVALGEGMPKAIGHRMRRRGWMACPRALAGLHAEDLGDAVVIVEGVADFWAMAGWALAGGRRVAVLGGVSGSFPGAGELPVRAGCRVTLALHHDEAGDRYAAQIVQALGGRGADIRRARLEAE
jgi:hypothetical protein